MENEEYTPEPDYLWQVTYSYYNFHELDLKATFTIKAPNAVIAISKSAEALHVMFTERAREVITLRSVKRDS